MHVKLVAAAVSASLALAGCAAMLPAPVPMASVKSAREEGKPHKCLLVMLPGRGDRASDYRTHGFFEALEARPLSVDAVAADAVFGYYARRTLFERLRVDVVEPAKARGYEQVWFLGISMGGLGALLNAKSEGGVTGAVLLAPFVGDEDVIQEIEKAGGPAAWKPGVIAQDDYQRELWKWLQGALPKDEPRLTLGFGESDRMAASHRLLASALPEGRVFRAEGAHDWPTWKKLWNAVLDGSDFSRSCAE
ncbi:MAG TPA: hypothetical protein VGK67_08830 [Myxococcales bacterium]|jgi:pimeloyl-ACP methyl ester carboxylesterase